MTSSCTVYTAIPSDEIHVAQQCLTSCSVLWDWCASRRLQLNASKTELIWFSTRTSLRRLSSTDRTLMIDSMDVKPSDVVRDLGVLLDSKLTLKRRVNRIASTCFYHLCRRRLLKRHVGVEVMKQLISSFIFSRLDYCHMLLIGLPFSTIAPLQRVQITAARLLLGLSWRDHVRPVLKELHWLPIVYRIQFKLALVMFIISTHAAAQTTSPILCRRVTVIRHGLVSARHLAATTLFHGQERDLVTEPFLWPALLYGTVYQQQFVKLTVCICLGTSSKHICLVYVLMTD